MYGSERLCFHFKWPLLAYPCQSKTTGILKQDNIMGNIFFNFLILNSKEKLINMYLEITDTDCFTTVLHRALSLNFSKVKE